MQLRGKRSRGARSGARHRAGVARIGMTFALVFAVR